ncbi:hypothetical protein DEU29_1444 [Idiomarina aquatica]|uniref:Uncharacterized protein n=1 Tax=Idiomarina aquatica TaxID=1327752 RepID=A0A4R6NX49_9GAMM|nr:hypothetical protein [Idiomarina aquatica]TDP26790.1 hypothetical protein DEU29_1444 [Idiomarina aquatica]
MIENNTALYTKAFIISAVLVVILSWTNALDYLAVNYVDDALLDAGIAFAIGRGINAAGSVLESMSISFTLGVGGSISIGEVISPLLDMVEDFSTVMKFAIGSLVLQKLLVEIVGTAFFNVLLTLTAICAVMATFFVATKYQLIAMKTFITLVLIRFLVVLMALLSGVASQLFLDEKLEQDLQALGKAEETMENINETPAVPEELQKEIQAQIKVKETQRASLSEQLTNLKVNLEEQQATVAKLEEEMEQYSITDTYNPFTSNEEAKLAKEKLNNAESALNDTLEQLDAAEEGLEEVGTDLESLGKQLRGESTGVLAGISDTVSGWGGKISGMANKLSYEELKGSMSSAIDSMLNAMVTFILRSILLPLLFLYVVSKFFKAVWGIDLGKKLKDKTDSLNSAKKHKAAEVQS